MSCRKPLRGLIHALNDAVKSELGCEAKVLLDNYAEFRGDRGIIDVQGTGLCRYFANDSDFDALMVSDEIQTHSIEDVFNFIRINIDDYHLTNSH